MRANLNLSSYVRCLQRNSIFVATMPKEEKQLTFNNVRSKNINLKNGYVRKTMNTESILTELYEVWKIKKTTVQMFFRDSM